MFEKKVDLDKSVDEFYNPTLDQLRNNHDFTVKDSNKDNITVKFGSWWSIKGNLRGSANLRFKEGTNTIDIDFSFLAEIFITAVVIYFPLLFVIGFAAYGGVYIISIFMAVVLLGFLKYHHYCFKKTTENYYSKLMNIFNVLGSEWFTFCENCGHELDMGKGNPLKRCPICGSNLQQLRK